MFKFLLFLLILYLLYRFFQKKRRQNTYTGRQDHFPPPPPSKITDVLVQDPICGAYVSSKDAVIVKDKDGKEVHFCSAKCRDSFLKQQQEKG